MKKVLIILASLVGLWLLTAIFMPSERVVTREIDIYAPADSVFEQFNTLKYWKKWSYWDQADSTMKSTYNGPESGVGATHSWESEQMGNGTLTIIESNRPTSIKYELAFEGMEPSIGSISLVGRGNDLQVRMELQMNLPFVFRPLGLISDFMIGPDFEASLEGLKNSIEINKTDKPNPKIK